MRVALAPEAAALLAALGSEDRLAYAVAFYAGVRRSEIYRLEWPDVLDGDRIATHSARDAGALVMRAAASTGSAVRAV